MLTNFKSALDDAADDAFCENIYENYLEDTAPDKNNGVSIEELAESLGITL